ncbi:MAG: hypothetical protein FJZ09_06410 [Candidatus Omnitrophica bacterium]|nr:hypothetical protein [Candidatus Omnitrophota bacterium]
MNRAYPVIISLLAAVVIMAFFMPWIRVESEAMGFFNKLFGGKKGAQVESISGFRIPIIANSEESKMMIDIIMAYDPDAKDPSKRSYLVWLYPTLALMILFFSLAFPRNSWVNLGCGILAALVFGFGMYKVMNADTNRTQFMTLTVGPGVWVTLWGYLAIGIAGLFKFVSLSIKKPQ